MTMEVICNRCRRAFTPDPGDYVRGLWRVCPECRAAEGQNATLCDDADPQRPITPATPYPSLRTVSARHGGPPSSWWEWFRRWLDDRRRRQLTPEGTR